MPEVSSESTAFQADAPKTTSTDQDTKPGTLLLRLGLETLVVVRKVDKIFLVKDQGYVAAATITSRRGRVFHFATPHIPDVDSTHLSPLLTTTRNPTCLCYLVTQYSTLLLRPPPTCLIRTHTRQDSPPPSRHVAELAPRWKLCFACLTLERESFVSRWPDGEMLRRHRASATRDALGLRAREPRIENQANVAAATVQLVGTVAASGPTPGRGLLW
ncbi:hypothetical protein PSPO01_09201 [Paraphaeosphaeria sporulosa]